MVGYGSRPRNAIQPQQTPWPRHSDPQERVETRACVPIPHLLHTGVYGFVQLWKTVSFVTGVRQHFVVVSV